MHGHVQVLATFDVELPEDLTPLCGDGSIEEFTLMPVHDALESLRMRLPLWKPNSALVMLDFAIRHGLVHTLYSIWCTCLYATRCVDTPNPALLIQMYEMCR